MFITIFQINCSSTQTVFGKLSEKARIAVSLLWSKFNTQTQQPAAQSTPELAAQQMDLDIQDFQCLRFKDIEGKCVKIPLSLLPETTFDTLKEKLEEKFNKPAGSLNFIVSEQKKVTTIEELGRVDIHKKPMRVIFFRT